MKIKKQIFLLIFSCTSVLLLCLQYFNDREVLILQRQLNEERLQARIQLLLSRFEKLDREIFSLFQNLHSIVAPFLSEEMAYSPQALDNLLNSFPRQTVPLASEMDAFSLILIKYGSNVAAGRMLVENGIAVLPENLDYFLRYSDGVHYDKRAKSYVILNSVTNPQGERVRIAAIYNFHLLRSLLVTFHKELTSSGLSDSSVYLSTAQELLRAGTMNFEQTSQSAVQVKRLNTQMPDSSLAELGIVVPIPSLWQYFLNSGFADLLISLGLSLACISIIMAGLQGLILTPVQLILSGSKQEDATADPIANLSLHCLELRQGLQTTLNNLKLSEYRTQLQAEDKRLFVSNICSGLPDIQLLFDNNLVLCPEFNSEAARLQIDFHQNMALRDLFPAAEGVHWETWLKQVFHRPIIPFEILQMVVPASLVLPSGVFQLEIAHFANWNEGRLLIRLKPKLIASSSDLRARLVLRILENPQVWGLFLKRLTLWEVMASQNTNPLNHEQTLETLARETRLLGRVALAFCLPGIAMRLKELSDYLMEVKCGNSGFVHDRVLMVSTDVILHKDELARSLQSVLPATVLHPVQTISMSAQAFDTFLANCGESESIPKTSGMLVRYVHALKAGMQLKGLECLEQHANPNMAFLLTQQVARTALSMSFELKGQDVLVTIVLKGRCDPDSFYSFLGEFRIQDMPDNEHLIVSGRLLT